VLKKSVRRFFRFAAKKLTSQIDLPTARASAKGKKTPENLAGKTVDDCLQQNQPLRNSPRSPERPDASFYGQLP